MACPVPSSVPVPNVVVPSLNVTVPEGMPEPGDTAATAAVKVTDWPKTEGLVEDASDVLVLALVTVCVSVVAVFPLKLLSPVNTASML